MLVVFEKSLERVAWGLKSKICFRNALWRRRRLRIDSKMIEWLSTALIRAYYIVQADYADFPICLFELLALLLLDTELRAELVADVALFVFVRATSTAALSLAGGNFFST